MKTYIVSIAVSTVLCAVVNMLTPEKWSKYVSVVTGFVITICIAQPMISILNKDILDGVSYTVTTNTGEGEEVLYKEIKTQLESRIEEDAETRLRNEFSKECIVNANVNMAADGQVEGVSLITVSGDKIDAVVIGRLREVYVAEQVKYVGTEKTDEKSE